MRPWRKSSCCGSLSRDMKNSPMSFSSWKNGRWWISQSHFILSFPHAIWCTNVDGSEPGGCLSSTIGQPQVFENRKFTRIPSTQQHYPVVKNCFGQNICFSLSGKLNRPSWTCTQNMGNSLSQNIVAWLSIHCYALTWAGIVGCGVSWNRPQRNLITYLAYNADRKHASRRPHYTEA